MYSPVHHIVRKIIIAVNSQSETKILVVGQVLHVDMYKKKLLV